MRRLLLALSLAGCRGESTTYIIEGAPSCVRSICEVTMSTVLTGTAANADFATGLTRPDSGEDPSVWSLVIENNLQEIEDREQALRVLAGVSSSKTKIIPVPLVRMFDPDYDSVATTWIRVISSGSDYWNGPSGGDTIYFEAPPLPVGAKITSVYAYLNGNGVGTLPSPMPTLTLTKNAFAVGGSTADSTVGSQADTTAVLATYNLVHLITISGLTETVADAASYRIQVTTSGSNSNCLLHALRIVVALP